MAATAISVAYLVVKLAMLRRELVLRQACRRKRLALPGTLADGINAGDRGNPWQLLKSLEIRIKFPEQFDPMDLWVYDCLVHDQLSVSPELYAELLEAMESGSGLG